MQEATTEKISVVRREGNLSSRRLYFSRRAALYYSRAEPHFIILAQSRRVIRVLSSIYTSVYSLFHAQPKCPLRRRARTTRRASSVQGRREAAMLFVKNLSVQGGLPVPSDESGIDALVDEKYDK